VSNSYGYNDGPQVAQPGLEVASEPGEINRYASPQPPYGSPVNSPPLFDGRPQSFSQPAGYYDPKLNQAYHPANATAAQKNEQAAAFLPQNSPRQEKRICGLKRWLFFLLLALIVLIIGGAVGGGIGGSQAGKKSSGAKPATATTSNSSSTATTTSGVATATSTPGSIAAAQVRDSNEIAVFYQDTATSDIYLSGYYGSGPSWHSGVKINGINPLPKPNSSIAAVYNLTDSETINLFYIAENNTMFNAYGTINSTSWTMGTLASDTSYSVLVADGGGMTACPWMDLQSTPAFSMRVYYIDRATSSVKELGIDPGTKWFVTTAVFEKAGPQSQISSAWLPGYNFSNITNEVTHLFYQDTRGNIRHLPGYNGYWSLNNAETLDNVAVGTYFSSVVWSDDKKLDTLRLFWFDSSGNIERRNGKGASAATTNNTGIGTFSAAQTVQATWPTVVKAQVPYGPIGVYTSKKFY